MYSLEYIIDTIEEHSADVDIKLSDWDARR